MPGLEVLGVVIGGLPLVIGSLQATKQSYNTRTSPQKDIELAKTLQALTDTLKRQHFFLRRDLETILTSQVHVLGSEKVSEILQCPHANYFRDSAVRQAVMVCLGDGYEVYVSTVRKCSEGIFALTEKLAGLKAPTSLKKKGFGRQSVPRKAEFDYLAERLEMAAVLLARLRVAAPMPLPSLASPGSMSRPGSRPGTGEGMLSRSRSVKVNSRVELFGQKADLVYGALLAGYGHPASCHRTHQMALWLPTGAELGREGANRAIGFTVGFRFDAGDSWRCFAVDVRVAQSSTSQLAVDPSRRQVTGDLCNLVANARSAGSILEMAVSEEGTLFYQELIASTPMMPTTSELTSLSTILHHSTPGTWTVTQRLRLSYMIASSVMQLCPTRWVLASLTSDSIFFTSDNAASLTSSTFTPKPLILRQLGSRDLAAAQYTSARSTLLELAILFLEIWHQRPFESYTNSINAPMDRDIWDRLRVVEGWAGDSREISEFMYEIVIRCIHCTFASEGAVPDWGDAVFREAFYGLVVGALEGGLRSSL